MGVDYLDSIDKNHEFLSPVGTDAFKFNKAGVPASGVLTGQDCCKLPEEVDLFGGQLGNYEGNLGTSDGGCVDNPFRWCDNLSNNDPEVMTFMSRTCGNMVVRMAYDNQFSHRNQKRLGRARAAMPARSRAARAEPAEGRPPPGGQVGRNRMAPGTPSLAPQTAPTTGSGSSSPNPSRSFRQLSPTAGCPCRERIGAVVSRRESVLGPGCMVGSRKRGGELSCMYASSGSRT